ncbi:MAG: hypothetical protein IKI22_02070 [Neisseriaceae bacterium]|nr:hypothetical protein [Neisseriaceae bacterium]
MWAVFLFSGRLTFRQTETFAKLYFLQFVILSRREESCIKQSIKILRFPTEKSE